MPTTFKITLHQNFRLNDVVARVTPASGSLNGHYRYIGTYGPAP